MCESKEHIPLFVAVMPFHTFNCGNATLARNSLLPAVNFQCFSKFLKLLLL